MYTEPVTATYERADDGTVVKAIQDTRLLVHIPSSSFPVVRSNPARLLLSDFAHPQYLDDDLFYLAWLPIEPLADSQPCPTYVQSLKCESMELLTISRDVTTSVQWMLSPVLRVQWMLLEEKLASSIDTMHKLMDVETLGELTSYALPVRVSARTHGYCEAHEDEQCMRNAAWLSRHVMFAMMAHLAFALAVCRYRNIPQWREVLERATDEEFATWARRSSTISGYKVGYRLGGLVDAREPLNKQAWQRYTCILLASGVPLWINYGPRQDSFEAQVQGTRVDWSVALSLPDFLSIEVSTGRLSTASPSSDAESALMTTVEEQPMVVDGDLATAVVVAAVGSAQGAVNDVVDMVQAEVPTQFSFWDNPWSFGDMLAFHYGLVAGDPLASSMPIQNAVRALGWRHVAVPLALANVARHLNAANRIPTDTDLSRLLPWARVRSARYIPLRVPQARDGCCYVIRNLSGDNYPWLLVVHSPVVLVHILRRYSDYRTEDIVHGLSLHGIPYALYRRFSRLFVGDKNYFHPICQPWITTDRQPGVDEFKTYLVRLKRFFRLPYRVRAAIQFGGVIWRIVCHMLMEHDDLMENTDDFLHGPDVFAHLCGGSECVLRVQGYKRCRWCWEDVLSKTELDHICGTYMDSSKCAWFLPSRWNRSC